MKRKKEQRVLKNPLFCIVQGATYEEKEFTFVEDNTRHPRELKER